MSDVRLNALTMQSIEKKFIGENSTFKQRVMEMLAHLKERRVRFLCK